jgi:hypothetical protein
MIINGDKYVVFMRGIYDCKKQDYWSKYVRERFGNHIDPHWTTELNEDIMFVKESVRYTGIK